MAVCRSDCPLPQPLGQKITAFQSQAKPVTLHAGAVLSCCLPNMQARLNVRACSDPVGMQSWGGISFSGLYHLLALHPGGGGREQGGVDGSTLQDRQPCSTSAPSLIPSLKCSRGPRNERVNTPLKAQLYLQCCSLVPEVTGQSKGWRGRKTLG